MVGSFAFEAFAAIYGIAIGAAIVLGFAVGLGR